MVWERHSILQAYMVFGGVPYYLSLIKPSESVVEAIDRLLFSPQGELREEYHRLFSSLFTNPEPHMTIVRALANHRYGLTHDELAEYLGKSDGGGLTKLLDNLEKCDFIHYHRVRLKKINKTGGYYASSDSFVQFYHTYLGTPSNDEHYWSHNLLSPKTNTFSVYKIFYRINACALQAVEATNRQIKLALHREYNKSTNCSYSLRR